MNFDDSASDAEFRSEVRQWISDNAPHEWAQDLEKSIYGELNPSLQAADSLDVAKAWQKKKYDSNWACLTWPKIYGGRAASAIQQVIWSQEEGVYEKLARPFFLGHGMCGPTLMEYGTEDQKQRYLPMMASGEEVWCQLFSEPAAGSDLAGLRTRAEREGEGWRINGQKIWTSGAHQSDFGMILTRTDAGVEKHKGLTMFFLDMRSPGVDVRPILQMSGHQDFNEVYFDDVIIPDSQRIGEVGQGWQVSLATLMNERLSVGSTMPTGFSELLELCCNLSVDGTLAIEDYAVIDTLADLAVRDSGLKYTSFRSMTSLADGNIPGPESSISKLVAASAMQEIAQFALDIQGPSGLISGQDSQLAEGRFQAMLMRSPGARVEGGTDEILRNIIAERVLGLPADIRVDKGIAFNKIPSA